MHIKTFRVQNFRRLKDVQVDLESDSTIFVGANNSGKTSATHLFELFLGQKVRAPFQVYDFTADCWRTFNDVDALTANPDALMPRIVFDLWFTVTDDDLHRVIRLLPGLHWSGQPVGLRMSYAPRDAAALLGRFAEAQREAQSASSAGESVYQPWPKSMTDYLAKRLQQEYEIKYFLLEADQCGADLSVPQDYDPYYLGSHLDGGSAIIDSILRVDFLHAQRHLSDSDSRGRSEDLSKRLSRFYERNLKQHESDLEALGAIAQSEARLNDHFANVFGDTLTRLGQVGYPGVGNPRLMVKASFNAHGILSSNTRIHYALPGLAEDAAMDQTLPDQYNGLGFKNLIYMVVEVLDFHEAWAHQEHDRPPIHLIIIEEPEAHLHAQLQQVFIRKIIEVLPAVDAGFQTQLIVTTHSPHIIYESNFSPIRYFCRSLASGLPLSEVKNLSAFAGEQEEETRVFLQQYIKVMHCDLFFADAAILVEGNVERLLLPIVIERFVAELRACHLTILEVGGAFAHKFEKLLTFLGLPALVITDLDSVYPSTSQPTSEGPDGEGVDDGATTADTAAPASTKRRACMVDTPAAVTSNETLKQWLPQRNSIADLLSLGPDDKAPQASDGNPGLFRVAYQTAVSVTWGEDCEDRAGRTLEEAFALENLAWTQSAAGKHLGLRVNGAADLTLAALHNALFARVKGFDKTKFALGLLGTPRPAWVAPRYIVEGLEWLRDMLVPEAAAEAAEAAQALVAAPGVSSPAGYEDPS